jgi:hypothetical protein
MGAVERNIDFGFGVNSPATPASCLREQQQAGKFANGAVAGASGYRFNTPPVKAISQTTAKLANDVINVG